MLISAGLEIDYPLSHILIGYLFFPVSTLPALLSEWYESPFTWVIVEEGIITILISGKCNVSMTLGEGRNLDCEKFTAQWQWKKKHLNLNFFDGAKCFRRIKRQETYKLCLPVNDRSIGVRERKRQEKCSERSGGLGVLGSWPQAAVQL